MRANPVVKCFCSREIKPQISFKAFITDSLSQQQYYLTLKFLNSQPVAIIDFKGVEYSPFKSNYHAF